MIVTLPPIAYTVTKPFSIDLERRKELGVLDNLCEVKIQNQSAVAIAVTIGDEAHWIGPQMADKFQLKGVSVLSIAPANVATAPVSGSGLQSGPAHLVSVAPSSAAASVQPSGTFALLVEVADSDSAPIPGVYPATLAAVTQVSTVLINPSVVVQVGSAAGQKVVSVPDVSPFLIGAQVLHQTPTGASQNPINIVGAVSAANGTITLQNNLTFAISVGDTLTVLAELGVVGQPSVVINPSVVIAVGSAAGQKVVSVPDVSPFRIGAQVIHETPTGANQNPLNFVEAISALNGTVTLQNNLTFAISVGDTLTVLPMVGISGEPKVILNPSVVITVGSAAGQKVVSVPDTSPFQIGTGVIHGTPTGANQNPNNIVEAISAANGTITLQINLLFAINIGDTVGVITGVSLVGQPVGMIPAGGVPGTGPLALPQIPVSISNAIASTGVVVLVAAVAGKTAYVLGGMVGFDAITTGMNLEDTAGNVRCNFPDVAADHSLDLKSAPIGAAGTGIQLHNASGASVNARGTLIYGQA